MLGVGMLFMAQAGGMYGLCFLGVRGLRRGELGIGFGDCVYGEEAGCGDGFVWVRLIQISATGLLGAYSLCGEIILVLRFERLVVACLGLIDDDVNASIRTSTCRSISLGLIVDVGD